MKNDTKTTERRLEKKASRPSLWALWKNNLKDWVWYVRENPDWYVINPQAAVRRWTAPLRHSLSHTRRKLSQVKSAPQHHRFAESSHALTQFLLFVGSCIPRLLRAVQERVLSLQKKWIRTSRFHRISHVLGELHLHPAVFMCGAAAIAAATMVLSLYTVGTTARYDGVKLGTVSSRSTVTSVVSHLEEATRQTLGNESYTIDPELLDMQWEVVARSQLTNEAALEAELTEQIGLVDYGYVLYVNDEAVAATKFAGALEELLEQLKVGYITDNTVTCSFQEKVEIRQDYVDASRMMNLGYIAELLHDTKQSEVTYTVKSGDVWSRIADAHQMSSSQLLDLNPGYNISLIHVGDVLTVSKAVSYLTVVNVERQSYVDDIPYTTTYQDDASLYTGDYRVLSPGKVGKADVTANVTYINGEEIDREIVASATLREPVTELQARGTKPRPSWHPTGSFRWPCNGRVTSRFGYRNTGIPGASTYHKGIDIANSYGTSILASDGGTVSYSGWMSGYGYLVIIDHGNGYKTYYGHNSSLVVSVGQHVYKGQLIARMGSTGVSSGNHCHFGIMKNGTFVNPLNYI